MWMKVVANNEEQQLQNMYFIGAREVIIKVGLFLRFQRQLKIVGIKFIQLQFFSLNISLSNVIFYTLPNISLRYTALPGNMEILPPPDIIFKETYS